MTPLSLEYKSKTDSSWRPCQVSLSSDASTSFGLIVDFGSEDSEEVIITEEEDLKHLRIRSVPLLGDECLNIKEGEHILAGQEALSGILFFDAEVKKVLRVRHSRRIQCRCTFDIKWLYLDRVETATVPASSVLKLAKNTVDDHPTVTEFLNSVKMYNRPDVSSFVSLFEESVLGFDLEKQIEEIGRFADTSRSRSPEDCQLQFKKDAVDLMGQVRHRTFASQGSSIHDQGPARNNSRRTTRSQRKNQVEAETIPPSSQPVITEPDRTHLSPLGARAALASMMYKLPLDSEFSASKLTSTISLDLASKYLDPDISIQDKVSIKDGLLSNVGAHAAPLELVHSEGRTSERRDAANKCFKATVQLNRLEKPLWTSDDTEDMGSEVVSVQRSSTWLQSGRKLETPRSAKRFTRSAIPKGSSSLSNDEVELQSSHGDAKICSPMRTPRITRSTVQKEMNNATLDVSEGLQESRSAHDTGSRLTRQAKQKGLEPSSDQIESKTSFEEMNVSSLTHTSRFTRSAIQKEISNGTVGANNGLDERKFAQNADSSLTNRKAKGHPRDSIESKASSEEMDIHGTHKPRLTRSAKQNEAQNVTVEVNKGLEENELARQASSDSISGDLVTEQMKETTKRKLLSSEEELNLSLAQENKKSQRVSNDITRSEGETPNASARRQSENNPASSKTRPVLRSSPRFTRSQKQ